MAETALIKNKMMNQGHRFDFKMKEKFLFKMKVNNTTIKSQKPISFWGEMIPNPGTS